MKTIGLLTLFALLLVARGHAAGPDSAPAAAPATHPAPGSDPREDAVRFGAVKVYIDPGDKPLAAYQFELTATAGDVKLVGVEGDERHAFQDPPYYDTRALLNNKVIVAAFSTAGDLPRGRARVATLMVYITGPVDPVYAVKLEAAASPDGEAIPAKISTEAVTPALAPAGPRADPEGLEGAKP